MVSPFRILSTYQPSFSILRSCIKILSTLKVAHDLLLAKNTKSALHSICVFPNIFTCSQTFLQNKRTIFVPDRRRLPNNFRQQNFCPDRRLSNILVLVVEPNKSESLVIVCSNFADFFLTIYEVGATFTIYQVDITSSTLHNF
jgi:hypothetical protein